MNLIACSWMGRSSNMHIDLLEIYLFSCTFNFCNRTENVQYISLWLYDKHSTHHLVSLFDLCILHNDIEWINKFLRRTWIVITQIFTHRLIDILPFIQKVKHLSSVCYSNKCKLKIFHTFFDVKHYAIQNKEVNAVYV